MNWQQLIFVVDRETAEALSDYLETHLAKALTMRDAGNDDQFETILGEKPLWPQTEVIALYEEADDVSTVIKAACAEFEDKIHNYRLELLPDQEWHKTWMDNFKPINFGETLAICPSWHTPADDHRHHIMLDPGMAFGTGTHPTTRLMLEWLDQTKVKDKTVIDYGTGSGILAIAASMLSASTVYAIDNDPNAVTTSIENVAKNHCEQNIHVHHVNQFMIDNRVDILIANILAKPLIFLAEKFSTHVKPDGFCVLSGVLKSQAEEVKEAYLQWFDFVDMTVSEDWVRLVLKRKED